jgi:hypothetical protein
MDSSLRLRFILLTSLFLAVIAVGLLVNAFYRETSRLTTVVLPPEITACAKDEDCGLSNMIGCCPCETGGGQGAINQGMGPQLKAFLHRACRKGVPCVNVFSCRDDLAPVCKHGRCKLIPASHASAGLARRS